MARIRRTNVLAACAFVVLTIAALFSFYQREPRYSGKSLSYWCDQLPFTDGCLILPRFPDRTPVWGWPSLSKPATTPAESVKIANLEDFAFEAIDALGTNTAPGLLARLQTKPSRLEAEWAHLQVKLKLRPKSTLKYPFVLRSHQQRTQALTAIVYLSHPCFIPELSRMTNSPDPWLSAASSHALSTIHDPPLRSNLQRRAAIALRKSRFNQDWRLTGMTMSTPRYLAFEFKRKDAQGISDAQGFVFFDKDGANPTVKISD